MDAPERNEKETGEIVKCSISSDKLDNKVGVLDIIAKEKEQFIEASEVLVVAGRGVKKEEDLKLLQELADLLGGQLACTRPVMEAGWLEAKRQVGLSGRTVRPKLIITCGVSGSVQFTAGMNNSDYIVAINKDENAPIFKTAHYGLVSGEHGIGYAKKSYLMEAMDPATIEIMRGIKKAFDPKNILNPHKVCQL